MPAVALPSVCRVLLLLSPTANRAEAVRLLQLSVQSTRGDSGGGGAEAVLSCPFPAPARRVEPFTLSEAEGVSAWLSAADESAQSEWAASMRALFPLSRAFGAHSEQANGELAAAEASNSLTPQTNGVEHS